MAKRQIKSHKGGRTSDFHCRIRPDYHQQLKAFCRTQGVTMADWLEERIKDQINNKQAADYRK